MFLESRRLIAANVVLGFLASVAVALRLVVRRKKKMSLAVDDYTILAAWAIALGLSIEGVYTGATNIFVLIPPTASKSERRNKILWIDVFSCHFVYGLIKISILFYYKRLFTTKRFHQIANIFVGIVTAWMLAAIFAQIFSVLPVDTWWKYNGIAKTTFDYQLWLLIMAVIDIALDIVTLALAFPVVKSLHIKTRKKLSLGGIFALGLFCVIASGVRTYYVWKNEQILHGRFAFSELQGTLVWIDIWGHIEASASITTACLPSIAPLIKDVKAPGLIVNGFRSLSSLIHPSRFSIGRANKTSRGSQPSVSGMSFRPGHTTNYTSTNHLHHEPDLHQGSDVEAQSSQPDSIVVSKTFGVHTESTRFHENTN